MALSYIHTFNQTIHSNTCLELLSLLSSVKFWYGITHASDWLSLILLVKFWFGINLHLRNSDMVYNTCLGLSLILLVKSWYGINLYLCTNFIKTINVRSRAIDIGHYYKESKNPKNLAFKSYMIPMAKKTLNPLRHNLISILSPDAHAWDTKWYKIYLCTKCHIQNTDLYVPSMNNIIESWIEFQKLSMASLISQ